jgi:23S rRNA pseudouridine2605 synthase
MNRAERLQKLLSRSGIASRRQAEQLILAGRVSLNGRVAILGDKADPTCDRLEVDGQRISSQHLPDLIYLLLHKPTGVISTCHDPQGRTTVLDLLPESYAPAGLYPVGRLDSDSTGALLLTNDGDLAQHLTHPRYHIAKTYQAWVKGNPSPVALQQWREGIWLKGKLTLPAQVQVLKQRYHPDLQTCLQLILHEGRNRQIRRVGDQLGYPVVSLHRTAIGPVSLADPDQISVPRGKYRSLSSGEIDQLRQLIDLSIATEAECLQSEGCLAWKQ